MGPKKDIDNEGPPKCFQLGDGLRNIDLRLWPRLGLRDLDLDFRPRQDGLLRRLSSTDLKSVTTRSPDLSKSIFDRFEAGLSPVPELPLRSRLDDNCFESVLVVASGDIVIRFRRIFDGGHDCRKPLAT